MARTPRKRSASASKSSKKNTSTAPGRAKTSAKKTPAKASHGGAVSTATYLAVVAGFLIAGALGVWAFQNAQRDAASQTAARAPSSAPRQPAAQPADQSAQSPDTAKRGADTPDAKTSPARDAKPGAETPDKSATANGKPRFDIVRVEPDGTAVIAGRAVPNADVTIRSNGKPIGTVKSNARGEWALVLSKPLAPGAHDITVAAAAPNAKQPAVSEQKVAIAVPERKDAKPLVVLSPRDKPSRVLQAPTPEPDDTPAKPLPKGALALSTVDYDDKGRIMFTGRAAPNRVARIYVNNKFLRDLPVKPNGAWQLDATGEISPGTHKLRVDEIDKRGKVTARIEVAFTRARVADVLALNKARKALGEGQNSVPDAAAPPPAANTQTAQGQPDAAAPSMAAKTPGGGPVAGEAPQQGGPSATPGAKPGPDGGPAQTPPQNLIEAQEAQPATPDASSKGAPAMAKDATKDVTKNTTTAMATPQAGRDNTTAGTPAPAAQTPDKRSNVQAETATPANPSNAQTAAPQDTVAAKTTPSPAQRTTQPGSDPTGSLVIQPGNNLWNISRVIYGRGIQYTVIYQANAGQIRNPHLIYPGQIFKTPGVVPPQSVDPGRREPLKPAN